MKKIFFCWLIILVAFVFNCSSPSPDSTSVDKNVVSVVIKGKAAIGACLPAGSPVQIRSNHVTTFTSTSSKTSKVMDSSSTETITPADLISTTVDDNGEYQ